MFQNQNQTGIDYTEIRKRDVTAKAVAKVQAIITRLDQGIAYQESIERECLTEVFFAFPTVTPKLMAICDRHLLRSHGIIDNAALPEVRALLPEFSVENCKLS